MDTAAFFKCGKYPLYNEKKRAVFLPDPYFPPHPHTPSPQVTNVDVLSTPSRISSSPLQPWGEENIKVGKGTKTNYCWKAEGASDKNVICRHGDEGWEEKDR